MYLASYGLRPVLVHSLSVLILDTSPDDAGVRRRLLEVSPVSPHLVLSFSLVATAYPGWPPSGRCAPRSLCPCPLLSIHWFGRSSGQPTPRVAPRVFWSLHTHLTLSHFAASLWLSYSVRPTWCQVHAPFWYVLSIHVVPITHSFPFLSLDVPLTLDVVYTPFPWLGDHHSSLPGSGSMCTARITFLLWP